MQFILIHENYNNNDFYNGCLKRIQNIVIGQFSIDLMEEEIMNLDKFDVKSVLDTRKYLISNYFKEIKIENEEFSKYNFVVNPNFLFEKRDVYLYSLALTYGFSIVLEIYNNQTFSKILEVFSNINSMDEIIQELFNTQLDNEHFYKTQLNLLYEYCKFLFNGMIGSDDK